MKIIKSFKDYSDSIDNSIVLIGKFDGIHLGHQKLISKALEIKRKTNYKILLISFFPNIFNLDKEYILTSKEKRHILSEYCLDFFFEIPLDNKLIKMKKEDFLINILINKLNMKYLICGDDFKFGKNGEGDINYIKEMAVKYDYKYVVLKKQVLNNNVISSEYIKELIKKSKLNEVKEALGREYFFIGKVIEGKRIGTLINIPTINVKVKNKILPKYGVYKSKTNVNNVWYKSLTNIGIKPTVSNSKIPIIETYILDFDRKIYNNEIIISLDFFIRDEKKFNSIIDLKKQIEKDLEYCYR